jgi:hypothetical protein
MNSELKPGLYKTKGGTLIKIISIDLEIGEAKWRYPEAVFDSTGLYTVSLYFAQTQLTKCVDMQEELENL